MPRPGRKVGSGWRIESRPLHRNAGHMARLVERPKARQELEDIAVRIAADGPSAARRFLAAVEKTYAKLAAMPEMGTVWEAESPRFEGLRYSPILRHFYNPILSSNWRYFQRAYPQVLSQF